MILAANQLTCAREDRVLFANVSFAVHPGDVMQIEGPNGVGKTSLLRLLTGLSRPVEGDITFNGVAISDCREEYHQALLYLGHKPGIKGALSPLENLAFYQRLHPAEQQPDPWAVLAKVGLAGFEEQPCAQLSAGQHRRVALARLWLSSAARIWILDEPFTAIDKQGVKVLERLLLRHVDAGGSVILTTHQDLSLMQDRLRTLRLGNL